MQLYEKNIKEVVESKKGPQIGAFFDFDGTIIYGYSAVKYLREQIRRGDIRPHDFPKIIQTLALYGLGEIDFTGLMAAIGEVMRDHTEQEYIEFGEALYKKHLAKLIYPESRVLIEEHLKKGHTVALISAATPYQVTAAARELDIEHVMCTQLEVHDGKFTGKIVEPACYGMGKVDAAQKLTKKFDIDPSQSFFYSDSDEDIDLLEWVGKPRPLNPNSRLRRIARGRGWPVQDFNSRGRVGIKDYVRTFATQSSLVTSFLAGLPISMISGSEQKGRNFSTSMFADLACTMAGIELDVQGEEHLWSSRPCVFTFNHQSQADVIILPALLRRDVVGVGKKEIGDVPVFGKIMQYVGIVLIDRENSASAVEAMKPLVDTMLKEGRSVCIAPEGTRSTSTHLGRFKKGAFHLAMQAGVPVVPIVIHNSLDVAPSTEFVFRPATVKVTVLPPVDTSDWRPISMAKHVEEVRDMYLVELDQMKYQKLAPKRRPRRKSAPKVSAKTLETVSQDNVTSIDKVKKTLRKSSSAKAKMKVSAKGKKGN
ncbi:MAG: HAD-IB family hydrolase [Acidiferrobacterales bacterium]|nr:HAD-IB family hydrolase [Acidiferrobacterales bacterium]